MCWNAMPGFLYGSQWIKRRVAFTVADSALRKEMLGIFDCPELLRRTEKEIGQAVRKAVLKEWSVVFGGAQP